MQVAFNDFFFEPTLIQQRRIRIRPHPTIMNTITIVESLPKFVTPDEHKILIASTPASFSDIPPVLRHKEDNVSITLDPAFEGFSVDNCANGTLYVIERSVRLYLCTTYAYLYYSVLVFMSANGRGIQVEYPSITLHAISRADNKPSIYCQLDEQVPSTDAPAEGEEEDTNMRELIIVPQASASRT